MKKETENSKFSKFSFVKFWKLKIKNFGNSKYRIQNFENSKLKLKIENSELKKQILEIINFQNCLSSKFSNFQNFQFSDFENSKFKIPNWKKKFLKYQIIKTFYFQNFQVLKVKN